MVLRVAFINPSLLFHASLPSRYVEESAIRDNSPKSTRENIGNGRMDRGRGGGGRGIVTQSAVMIFRAANEKFRSRCFYVMGKPGTAWNIYKSERNRTDTLFSSFARIAELAKSINEKRGGGGRRGRWLLRNPFGIILLGCATPSL